MKPQLGENTRTKEQNGLEGSVMVDGWTKEYNVSKGMEREWRGSVCLLALPIGTAVSQTVTDVESLRWER